MDTNVKGWIQMLISIGFKLKDGYKCYDGLWIWYRMATNVKGYKVLILVGCKLKDGHECWIGLIQMLNRIDTNVDIGWIPFPF